MKFSKTVSSRKRNSRKKQYNADSNEKRIIMSSRINESFRKKYISKTTSLRKGDEVKIMRGIQKGKTGKIVQCSRKRVFVYVNTVTYKKKNGDEAYLPIHPSNVQIQNFTLIGDRRLKLRANFAKT
jgi:ribosomal protein uL24